MLNPFFPKQADNNFRGWRLSIWLLAVFVLMKFTQGAASTFNTRFVMTGADAIPLDHYAAAGAQTMVTLFALLGLYMMAFAVPSFVALIRYRALIPLMYLLWLIEEAGKLAILTMNPIARSTTFPTGAIINRVLIAVLLVGFVLSLMKRPLKQESRPQSQPK